MALNLLVSRERGLVICEEFECHSHGFNLLFDCLPPQVISILTIQLVGFCDSLRNLDTKLVRSFMVSSVLESRKDPIPPTKKLLDPPIKRWFMVNLLVLEFSPSMVVRFYISSIPHVT